MQVTFLRSSKSFETNILVPEEQRKTSNKFVSLIQKGEFASRKRSQLVLRNEDSQVSAGQSSFLGGLRLYLLKLDKEQMNIGRRAACLPGYSTLKLPSVLGNTAKQRFRNNCLNMCKQTAFVPSKSELSDQIKETLADFQSGVQTTLLHKESLKAKARPQQVLQMRDLGSTVSAIDLEFNQQVNSRRNNKRTNERRQKVTRIVKTRLACLEADDCSASDQMEDLQINQNFCDFVFVPWQPPPTENSSISSSQASSVFQKQLVPRRALVGDKTMEVLTSREGFMRLRTIIERDRNFLCSYFGMSQPPTDDMVVSQPNIAEERPKMPKKVKNDPWSLENLNEPKRRQREEEGFVLNRKFFQSKKSIWMNIIESLLDARTSISKKQVGYYRLFLVVNQSKLRSQSEDSIENFVGRLAKDIETDVKFDFSFRPIDINQVLIR